MKPANAVIIKDRTDDDLFVMPPDTPLKIGQTIEVDLDTRRTERWRDDITGREVPVEMVNLVQRDLDGHAIPFPIEMLLL